MAESVQARASTRRYMLRGNRSRRRLRLEGFRSYSIIRRCAAQVLSSGTDLNGIIIRFVPKVNYQLWRLARRVRADFSTRFHQYS